MGAYDDLIPSRAPDNPYADLVPNSPSFLDQTAAAGLKGFASGGPISAILRMSGVALNKGNELLAKGAYNAGGAVSEGAAKLGVPPEVAGGLGVAANMGVNAIPMAIGGGIGAKAAPAVQSGAKWLMETALKPARADRVSGKAARAVQTMFDEFANPTVGGVDKMKGVIAELNDKAEKVIAESPASVKTDVEAYLKSVIERYKARPDRLQAELDIANAAKQFAEHPLVAGASEIPVQAAHDLKRGYQAAIGDKYGEMKTATTEAEKGIARAMRERVAAAAPDVAPINARESDLINAMNVANRGFGVMSGNKNPIGLGILHPSTIPLWLLDRYAGGKATLAQLLYHGAKPLSEATGAAVGGLYSGSLSSLQP